MKQYLSVVQQLPEFVRSDYPAFVEFLKSYYQWLEEEYSPGKLETLVDIDDTVEDFLVYFRKQLDVHNITINTTDRAYLRHIKELYTSKGSFAGFEFLFKILFNQQSSITQPWDYVFKTSEGKWSQDTSLLLNVTSGNIRDVVSGSILVTDAAGRQYKTFVRDVNIRRNGVVELFVNRFTFTDQLVTVQSLDGTVSAIVLPTTVKAKVARGGSGFKIGQVFPVDSNSGSGTLIKIKSVGLDGSVKSVDIITFGTNYQSNFNVFISPDNRIDLKSIGSRITLGELTYVSNDNIDSQNESGSIVNHTYTEVSDPYLRDMTYVGDTVAELKSQPYTVYTSEYAQIDLTVGTLCVYPGYYLDSNNVIGDLVYIQDSFYYQAFSYVTVLEESLDKYSTLLRRVLHPAGTKHFATYQINNTLQLNPVADPSLNLFAKAAIQEIVELVDQLIMAYSMNQTDDIFVSDESYTVTEFNRIYADDIITNDARRVMDVSKLLTTTAVMAEDFSRVVDYVRSYNDGMNVSDDFSVTSSFLRSPSNSVSLTDVISVEGMFDRLYTDDISVDEALAISMQTTLSDSAQLTDVFAIYPGISFSENVSFNDNLTTINTDKYFSNNVGTSNTGGIFMTPYYVQIQPDYYWAPGYLENERAITN